MEMWRPPGQAPYYEPCNNWNAFDSRRQQPLLPYQNVRYPHNSSGQYWNHWNSTNYYGTQSWQQWSSRTGWNNASAAYGPNWNGQTGATEQPNNVEPPAARESSSRSPTITTPAAIKRSSVTSRLTKSKPVSTSVRRTSTVATKRAAVLRASRQPLPASPKTSSSVAELDRGQLGRLVTNASCASRKERLLLQQCLREHEKKKATVSRFGDRLRSLVEESIALDLLQDGPPIAMMGGWPTGDVGGMFDETNVERPPEMDADRPYEGSGDEVGTSRDSRRVTPPSDESRLDKVRQRRRTPPDERRIEPHRDKRSEPHRDKRSEPHRDKRSEPHRDKRRESSRILEHPNVRRADPLREKSSSLKERRAASHEIRRKAATTEKKTNSFADISRDASSVMLQAIGILKNTDRLNDRRSRRLDDKTESRLVDSRQESSRGEKPTDSSVAQKQSSVSERLGNTETLEIKISGMSSDDNPGASEETKLYTVNKTEEAGEENLIVTKKETSEDEQRPPNEKDQDQGGGSSSSTSIDAATATTPHVKNLSPVNFTFAIAAPSLVTAFKLPAAIAGLQHRAPSPGPSGVRSLSVLVPPCSPGPSNTSSLLRDSNSSVDAEPVGDTSDVPNDQYCSRPPPPPPASCQTEVAADMMNAQHCPNGRPPSATCLTSLAADVPKDQHCPDGRPPPATWPTVEAADVSNDEMPFVAVKMEAPEKIVEDFSMEVDSLTAEEAAPFQEIPPEVADRASDGEGQDAVPDQSHSDPSIMSVSVALIRLQNEEEGIIRKVMFLQQQISALQQQVGVLQFHQSKISELRFDIVRQAVKSREGRQHLEEYGVQLVQSQLRSAPPPESSRAGPPAGPAAPASSPAPASTNVAVEETQPDRTSSRSESSSSMPTEDVPAARSVESETDPRPPPKKPKKVKKMKGKDKKRIKPSPEPDLELLQVPIVEPDVEFVDIADSVPSSPVSSKTRVSGKRKRKPRKLKQDMQKRSKTGAAVPDVKVEHSKKVVWEFLGHQDKIVKIMIYKKCLLSCSVDGTVKMFKIMSKRGVPKCKATFTHRSEGAFDMDVARVTVDKSCLVVASRHGMLQKFCLESTEQLGMVPTGNPINSFCMRWGLIYVGDQEGCVTVHKVSNLNVLRTFPMSDTAVSCVATTSEGGCRILLTGCKDGTITLRDARSGVLLRCLTVDNQPPLDMLVANEYVFSRRDTGAGMCREILMHSVNGESMDRVKQVLDVTGISVDGNRLYMGSRKGLVRAMDLEKKEPLPLYYGAGQEPITAILCWNQLLVTGDASGKLEAFHVDNGDVSYVCQFGRCRNPFVFYEDLTLHVELMHVNPPPDACLVSDCDVSFVAGEGKHVIEDREEIVKHILSHSTETPT